MNSCDYNEIVEENIGKLAQEVRRSIDMEAIMKMLDIELPHVTPYWEEW